jgi:hypothetical protein
MLFSMNDAFGFDSESFEYDASSIWDMPDLGSGTVVTDFHAMLDGTKASISLDNFSEREIRKDWGVYEDDLKLVLAKDDEWTRLDATAGGKVNGSFSTLTWDATSWIDQVLDVGLTNSNMDFAWFPGTWTDDGLNNVYVDNIVAIPEPATYGLITIFGGGLLLFRRRFMS